jgi:hypothetical protein
MAIYTEYNQAKQALADELRASIASLENAIECSGKGFTLFAPQDLQEALDSLHAMKEFVNKNQVSDLPNP